MFVFTRKSVRSLLASRSRNLGKVAAALAIVAGLMFAPAPMLSPSALAGDLDYSQGDGTAGKYVRIGLNKSIVVHLPADAKDVLVGNPEVVDAVVRTKNTAYLFARSIGQTNIFFFDAGGQQILSLDLEVSLDMAALQKLINRTIKGTQIKVDTIGDSVVLGGTAATPSEAKMAMDLAVKFVGGDDPEKAAMKVMNTINVTGKEQVMLRVRVAEVQRDVLKQFGVDSSSFFNIGKLGIGFNNVNPLSANPNGALSPGGGLSLNYNDGCALVPPDADNGCGLLRAMERDGLLRTLAEPTLTAISGEAAKFLAGGEFPVPVAGRDNEITIEFKPFGVGLGFTPIVMSEGRISLKIDTEVSELSTESALTLASGGSNANVVIPSLRVRRASTTVELPSGGSMVMAGLIKESTRQNIDGFPGLKNLPILGTLFRSRDFLQNQTELVVIVTPFVVDPVSDKQLVLPTDGLNVATDRQTILFGRLTKIYGTPGQKPQGVYHGNVGFIVE